MRIGGGWIIEPDVERFFDTLDRAQLRAFLRRRVCDGVILRLIGKWVTAGVLGDGPCGTQRLVLRRVGSSRLRQCCKTLAEFSLAIPRARLRPSYGNGFQGAPLQISRPTGGN